MGQMDRPPRQQEESGSGFGRSDTKAKPVGGAGPSAGGPPVFSRGGAARKEPTQGGNAGAGAGAGGAGGPPMFTRSANARGGATSGTRGGGTTGAGGRSEGGPPNMFSKGGSNRK